MINRRIYPFFFVFSRLRNIRFVALDFISRELSEGIEQLAFGGIGINRVNVTPLSRARFSQQASATMHQHSEDITF